MGDSTKRVLVVDDSSIVREVIVFSCRRVPVLEHATIDEAGDGVAALELLQQHYYDLVITDIKMPGLDGIELVRRVREDLGNPDTPIILVSVLAGEQDVCRGLEAGAVAHIPKPLSPYRICLAIEQVLGSGSPPRETS